MDECGYIFYSLNWVVVVLQALHPQERKRSPRFSYVGIHKENDQVEHLYVDEFYNYYRGFNIFIIWDFCNRMFS